MFSLLIAHLPSVTLLERVYIPLVSFQYHYDPIFRLYNGWKPFDRAVHLREYDVIHEPLLVQYSGHLITLHMRKRRHYYRALRVRIIEYKL